ncbi:MAG: hypothetical protein WBB42_17300 [Polyangiales bacterium]
MARFVFTVTVAGLLLAILIGGCSLIVDFDRSLLDSGMDGGVDAGLDATVDAREDAAADAAADAG